MEVEAIMEIWQVAQHADNLDRAAAVYEALLGGPPAARFDPPGPVFFKVGRSRLLLDSAVALVSHEPRHDP